MKAIISNIKSNHVSILEIVVAIQRNIRNYDQVKNIVDILISKLLDHFKIQDDSLFESLNKYYVGDEKKLKIIEYLLVDLRDTKITLMEFSDKYSGLTSDSKRRQFPKDFTDFSKKIKEKFSAEKEYLLPLIEKMGVDNKK